MEVNCLPDIMQHYLKENNKTQIFNSVSSTMPMTHEETRKCGQYSGNKIVNKNLPRVTEVHISAVHRP